jgi:hypothetical protein
MRSALYCVCPHVEVELKSQPDNQLLLLHMCFILFSWVKPKPVKDAD